MKMEAMADKNYQIKVKSNMISNIYCSSNAEMGAELPGQLIADHPGGGGVCGQAEGGGTRASARHTTVQQSGLGMPAECLFDVTSSGTGQRAAGWAVTINHSTASKLLGNLTVVQKVIFWNGPAAIRPEHQ